MPLSGMESCCSSGVNKKRMMINLKKNYRLVKKNLGKEYRLEKNYRLVVEVVR